MFSNSVDFLSGRSQILEVIDLSDIIITSQLQFLNKDFCFTEDALMFGELMDEVFQFLRKDLKVLSV